MMENIYNTYEAAAFLGYQYTTLDNWRSAKKGPRYFKKGKNVFYKKEDLIDWLANNINGKMP